MPEESGGMNYEEYEIVHEIFNECANNQMRDVFFEETEVEDPEIYVRALP